MASIRTATSVGRRDTPPRQGGLAGLLVPDNPEEPRRRPCDVPGSGMGADFGGMGAVEEQPPSEDPAPGF